MPQVLVHALDEPIALAGADVLVGASLGVAFGPTDGRTSEEWISNADAALYRAKRGGHGTFRFFRADMDQALQSRQQLIADMRGALARGEFELHFQPFVSSGTSSVTGCEALIHWSHPVHGLVSPVDFIPLAEESGLSIPIGPWILQQACRTAVHWGEDRRVSVNLSYAFRGIASQHGKRLRSNAARAGDTTSGSFSRMPYRPSSSGTATFPNRYRLPCPNRICRLTG